MNICETLKSEKVIMAVKDSEGFNKALASDKSIIFLLKSNLLDVGGYVERAHRSGKKIFVHLDLMDGLGKDEAAVEYVAKHIRPDGIITTKLNMARHALSLSLETVFRVFLIDSQGLSTAYNTISKFSPTAVEIMPGIIPEVTAKFAMEFDNLIAGGMVSTREHLDNALSSGALGVSTSNEELWAL